MSTILVQVVDNSSGQTTSGLVLNQGSTVRSALEQIGVSGSNYTIRVNRAQANLDTVLYDGDSVSFTRTDLKGADPILEFTFDDILNAGNRPLGADAGAFDKAVADYSERAKRVHTEVVGEMLSDARNAAPRVNAAVTMAENALEKARENQARFTYCVNQLQANNPFALMAFLGRKQDAADVCARLGCSVPAADSPLWNTSQK